MFEKLIDFVETLPDAAKVQYRSGLDLHEQGEYDKAAEPLELALEICKQFSANQLVTTRIESDIIAINISGDEGATYCRSAQRQCERILKIQECLIGENHLISAGIIRLIGRISHRRREYDDALHLYYRALRIYGTNDLESESARTMDFIGVAYLQLGRWEDARNCFLNELRIKQKNEEHDYQKEPAIFNAAACCLFSGDFEVAFAAYRYAVEIYGRKLCELEGHEGMSIKREC